MKLLAALGTAAILFVATGVAHATPKLVTLPGDPRWTADEPPAGTFANPASRTIFLNRCVGGCTIRSGPESATNSTSSIQQNGVVDYTAFKYGDSEWQQLLTCVRSAYAPFNVTVTDVKPTSGTYWMTVVGGTASQFGGLQNGTLGVARATCSPIDNSISFAFLNDPEADNDVNEMCWIISQETAHNFGLAHELLVNDPMTYEDIGQLPTMKHTFMNSSANCGAYTAGDEGNVCRATQNSYQLIMNFFGPNTPTPPVVTITSPADGAQVDQGFAVQTTVTDDQGVAGVAMSIDGELYGSLTTGPYNFSAPTNLSQGTHRVVVTATDIQGTPATKQIDVVIGDPCSTPDDCASQGDNLTCVGGRCVPDSDAPNGLGHTCDSPTDCYSTECAKDSSGNSYCVEDCTVGGDDCPSGFDCLNAGHGICWPADGGGGTSGGCATTSTDPSPTLPIGLGLVIGALVIRRRVTRTKK